LCGEGIHRTFINLVAATHIPAIKIYTTAGSTAAIIGGGLSDFAINCNGTTDGVLISAIFPWPITRGVYENICIRNTKIGFKAISDTGNIIYQNTFRSIWVLGPTPIQQYAFYTSSACYNSWSNLEASDVGAQAYGFYMTEFASVLTNLTGDGVSFIDIPFGICSNFVIETIKAATPVVNTAVRFNRIGLATNITLLDIDDAQCSYGVVLGSLPINLQNVEIFNPSLPYPSYPLATGGGSGTISNFKTGGGFKVEQYEPDITQRYSIIESPTLTQFSLTGARNGTQAAVPDSTATTVYTVPNVTQGTFLVTVGVIGPGATDWSSTYLLVTQQATTYITSLHTGSYVTAVMSGLNLRVTQTSGSAADVVWSCSQLN